MRGIIQKEFSPKSIYKECLKLRSSANVIRYDSGKKYIIMYEKTEYLIYKSESKPHKYYTASRPSPIIDGNLYKFYTCTLKQRKELLGIIKSLQK